MFLLLPNQLFDKKHLDKKEEYLLYEHPHFFKDYKYNKKKLILHRASMKYYLDYLKKNKFNVSYLEFNSPLKLKKGVEVKMFDPINKLDRLKLKSDITVLDSPNFLLKTEHHLKYRKKTDKFFFNGFYMWSKKETNILPGVKSQDKSNRKKLPKDMKIPPVPSNKTDLKYVKEAIQYVEKHFPKNYGNRNLDEFIYPISHTTAKKWLLDFIEKRFKLFNDYQDHIDDKENFLFHSLLSSSINIGLINPNDIVDIIKKYKGKIPLNSYEGYIRQLFWREYQRYCYIYYDFNKVNYFGNTKKLTKAWYTGKTGSTPVDDAIVNGFNTGYLHHILRLMVVGNYMNLSGIAPKEGFKWFMEFSCDSYEWVMYQNVMDMVFFVSGGATMRRPYISSSNYIMNMSNYKRDEWCDKWDKLYRDFTKKHRSKLLKFRYYFKGL